MKLKFFICLISSVFLVSCASQVQQTKFYVLPYLPLENRQTADLNIDINLAEYLKQDFMVIENQESELTFAQNHRWAEPLEQLITRYLSKRILSAQPENLLTQTQLEVNIERFYGSVSGQVYLSGYWQWQAQPEKADQRHYFDLKAKQSGPGYKNYVETSAGLLNKLAGQIVEYKL
mgnify:CR=1 FL=1